jgi:DNA-binding transcriptional ArsR family regulator
MTNQPEPTKKSKQKRRESLRPHPARDQILDVMRSYGKPISPTQIARITGHTLGSTAYHVRVLLQAGVVVLADEGRVRGAVEHFYEPAPDDVLTDPVAQLLGLCNALTVPDPRGGYPQSTVLDDPARAELSAVVAEIKPRVQAIALAATERQSTP